MSNVPKLLQVASRTEIVIFDLYKLNSSPTLDKALTTIFQNDGILKLGCGVGDDIKNAAKSYSHMAAFKQVRGVVNLQTLFSRHVQATGLQVCPQNAQPAHFQPVLLGCRSFESSQSASMPDQLW